MVKKTKTVMVTVAIYQGNEITHTTAEYQADHYSESGGYLRLYRNGQAIASFAPEYWRHVEYAGEGQ